MNKRLKIMLPIIMNKENPIKISKRFDRHFIRDHINAPKYIKYI